MATLREIRAAKERVRRKMVDMIHENPESGPFEFLRAQLELSGADVSEIETIEDARMALKTLPKRSQKDIQARQKMYNKEYYSMLEELKSGKLDKIKRLPAIAAKTITKGAAIGTSVAGVVNTLAPNLFPTMVGYYAGSASIGTLQKLGLVTIGAFSTPEIAKGAVLVAGAAVGAVVYTAGKAVYTGLKKIAKKSIDKRIEEENSDRASDDSSER